MMLINSKNAETINTKDVYLHDSFIKRIEYSPSERRIVVSINYDKYCTPITKMIFNNVVGAKTTLFETLQFCSGRILDFYLLKKSDVKLINELYDESEKEKSKIVVRNDKGEIIRDAVTSNMDNMEQLIETEFFLDSADKMTIVCEYIEIETA